MIHHDFVQPRLLSIGLHVVLVAFALIPGAAAPVVRPKLNETAVALYTLSRVVVLTPLQHAGESGGSDGGGKHELTPACRGVLPRGAEKQFAPPDPEPSKSPKPELIVEPTIVAPQLALVRPLTLLKIGDPYGVVGRPSSGRGTGGGIGDGIRSRRWRWQRPRRH